MRKKHGRDTGIRGSPRPRGYAHQNLGLPLYS